MLIPEHNIRRGGIGQPAMGWNEVLLAFHIVDWYNLRQWMIGSYEPPAGGSFIMFNLSNRQLAVSGAIVGLALCLSIGLSIRSGVFVRPTPPITISETTPEPSTRVELPAQKADTAPSTSAGLFVHVAGRVKNPGVYCLKPGSRVNDAIKAAGGGLPNSDLESINLAQKLSDGDQVLVAKLGKAAPITQSAVSGPKSGSGSTRSSRRTTGEAGGERSRSAKKLTQPGKETIHINTAGADGLEKLPGIGPAMAQRVLDYRKQNGGFKSIEELQEVRGIGPAKYEKLRPFVTL